MTKRVHFIYLGGEFLWQHWRAIETARVHEADETIIHCAEPLPDLTFSYDVTTKPLDLPAWLRDHPIKLSNVKDWYLWNIMGHEGGLYLDLDTISLKPCWDLLTRQMVVSQEWEDPENWEHPYNSAVVLGKRESWVAHRLKARSLELLRDGASRWGTIGPHLLTEVVAAHPHDFDVAPFGVLSGWRDGTIRCYYAGERPGPDVRVAHLYSSSNMDAFRADRWMPC